MATGAVALQLFSQRKRFVGQAPRLPPLFDRHFHSPPKKDGRLTPPRFEGKFSDFSMKTQVLWLGCRVLHPLIGGDRIRTYQMLRVLKKEAEITFLCLRTVADSEEAKDRSLEYCDRLVTVAHPDRRAATVANRLRLVSEALCSPQPLIATKYDSGKLRRRLVELLQGSRCDLVICDYLSPFINLLELHQMIESPLILFHHNVESAIWERHRDNTRNPVKRWLYHLQWKRTRRLEDRAAGIVDGQITVSEDDQRHFAEERGMKNVLGAVPTGVDFQSFQPNPALREPHTIAFLGAMDWHANVDAIEFFVDKVLPLIREKIPTVQLLIIGRNPVPKIRSLAEKDEAIEVSGTVDEVQPWLQRAAVMILPLRVGGGTRIKVYESVAAGVPVVSTSVGVEGLDLEPGSHFRRAENATSFAAETIDLLENPKAAAAMAKEARDYISTRYSWEAVCSRFSDLCRKAVESGQP